MLGTATVPEFEGPPMRMVLQPLENRTFEANLEYKYTEYIKDEFTVTGGAEIVQDAQDADYILKGAIESVTLPTLTFTENQTQESRVTVNVKVQVNDRKTGKLLWQKAGTSSAEFFVGSSPNTGDGTAGIQFNRVLQDRALEQAGQFVAETLADQFSFAREQGVFTPKPAEPKPGVLDVPRSPGERSSSPVPPAVLTPER
ncbi:MAG: LPS assembly lipoprotein LptE [Nitrospirales bacterium]|nr:LPS assembly lipoprotein LptE [Nitrospirales bacterium]